MRRAERNGTGRQRLLTRWREVTLMITLMVAHHRVRARTHPVASSSNHNANVMDARFASHQGHDKGSSGRPGGAGDGVLNPAKMPFQLEK